MAIKMQINQPEAKNTAMAYAWLIVREGFSLSIINPTARVSREEDRYMISTKLMMLSGPRE